MGRHPVPLTLSACDLYATSASRIRTRTCITLTHPTILGPLGQRCDARVVADSSFDFAACLQRRLADEDASYSQLFSLSPLSSPSTTPESSPKPATNPTLAPSDDADQPVLQATSDECRQPNILHVPVTSPQSTSAPRQYANSTDKRKAKLKKGSKIRRDRHRSLQKASSAFGAYKITSALVCRHVEGSEHIVCDADVSQLKNVASTGFVGVDDRRRSKTAYTLEQLVGKNSRFGFRLHRWDGRFVFLFS